MLELPKDVFARLALSAKNLKNEDLDKKVQETPAPAEPSKIEIINYDEPVEKAYDINPIQVPSAKNKLDDKIIQSFDNPEVKSLKQELAKVEKVFLELKQEHAGSDIVDRIEQKIEQLKKLIESKSFV